MNDRERFLQKRVPKEQWFPYYDEEYLGIEPSAADLRRWQRSYRRDDGTIDPHRIALADESLLAIVLVDQNTRARLFTFEEIYGDPERDVPPLFGAETPGPELVRLTTAVSTFCGLNAAQRRALQDAAKNSSETRSSESSTESPVEQDAA